MRMLLKSVLTILTILLGSFIVICVFMFWQQDRLLFYPVRNQPSLLKQWEKQRVEITSGDNVTEGWWFENPAVISDKVIIYFGGNAEDVLYGAADFNQLGARRMLVTNYRGYGASKGKPSQGALFEDALAIYDYAVKQAGVRPEQVIVMGRSLGSGVATYLAANRPVGAVALITPFDSIAAVAQRLYPLLPIRILIRHPFPSETFAPKISRPVLIIAAERDDIIPPEHARRLFEQWAGEKKMHVLPGVGHNDIESHPDYYRLLNHFIAGV